MEIIEDIKNKLNSRMLNLYLKGASYYLSQIPKNGKVKISKKKSLVEPFMRHSVPIDANKGVRDFLKGVEKFLSTPVDVPISAAATPSAPYTYNLSPYKPTVRSTVGNELGYLSSIVTAPYVVANLPKVVTSAGGSYLGGLAGEEIGDAFGNEKTGKFIGNILGGIYGWRTGRFLPSIISNKGVAISTPTYNKNRIIYWVGKDGTGSSIALEGTKTPWMNVSQISSYYPGIGRKLYDAAIGKALRLGYLGIRSGDYLMSAPKTYSTWGHYPNKVFLGNVGRHYADNVPEVVFYPRINAPVYGLTESTQNIPVVNMMPFSLGTTGFSLFEIGKNLNEL